MSADYPPVAHFAAAATVAFGLLSLVLVSIALWIMATTGEPIVLNPHRYGEAWVEAVLFAVLLGIGCYGTAVLDYLNRN